MNILKNMDESVKKYLREVLAFYAKEENYVTGSTGFAAQYDPSPSKISERYRRKSQNSLKNFTIK